MLAKIFESELFEISGEPSRAELFDQKLEPNPSQAEPSLGSGATLEFTIMVAPKSGAIP